MSQPDIEPADFPRGPLNESPGTVRLLSKRIDPDDGHAVGGSLILVPAPTSSPNDPLTWSKGSKLWIKANLLLWTFLANACIAWTSPAWAIWVETLQTDYNMLGYGQGLLVLACGVGVMFLQPLALKYGRRLVYMIGSLLIIAGLICGLAMTNITLFIVYMLLAGIGSAPSYSVIVSSLLDLSFLHQKGFALSIYGFAVIFGNFLSPLAAGYIVDAQGWQWCFRYLLIFFGLSTLTVLLTVEETSFARKTILGAEHAVLEGQAYDNTQQMPQDGADTNSGKVDQHHQLQTQPSIVRPSLTQPSADERLGYLQRMTLWRPNEDAKAPYWRLTLSMFMVATLPASIWASFQLAISTLLVSLVMTTQASFFSLPPYNFTAGQMGLMYLPLLVGSIVGSALGGPATDWLLVRLAGRQGGIHEPENRLWCFIPVPFIAAGSALLYGLGAFYGLHWAIPCFGLFLCGVYLNLALPICLGYALDSYPDLEDEVVQLSNFVRNVVGGALTFAIQPWINHSGPRNTTIFMAVIFFLVHISSVGFQIYGKAIRAKTAKKYYSICRANH